MPVWYCYRTTHSQLVVTDSPPSIRGKNYLVCSLSCTSPRHELAIEHHWSLVSTSFILPQLCRRIQFDDTLFSFALHGQLIELLPVDSIRTFIGGATERIFDQQSLNAEDSQRTEPFDIQPSPYIPRSAPSTPSAEDTFVPSLLPIIALGSLAFIPSLLLVVILLWH